MPEVNNVLSMLNNTIPNYGSTENETSYNIAKYTR
jgi:hypothetical protein